MKGINDVKVCPRCKSIDVPDTARVCPYCLAFDFEAGDLDEASEEPSFKEQSNSEKKTEGISSMVAITFMAIMFLVAIVVLISIYLKNSENPFKDYKSDYTYNTERTKAELADAMADMNAEADIAELKVILERSCEISDKYGMSDMVSDEIVGVFADYKNKVLERIEILDGQEARPVLYMQMKLDLSDATEISERMEESGLDIDAYELYDKLDKLPSDYFSRLCTTFDDYVADGIEKNGIISRSTLWSVMERLEETDLYIEDENNVLYCRYRTAYIYHIDSELENMSKEQAVQKILENLASTGYNPLFIYYLSEVYDVDDAKVWYAAFNSLTSDFMFLDLAEMKNFVYTYNTSEKYAAIRAEFSDYMKNFI